MKNMLKTAALKLLAAALCSALAVWVAGMVTHGKCGEFMFTALLQSGPVMSWGFALMFLSGLFVVMERLWCFTEHLPFLVGLATGSARKKGIFENGDREEILKKRLGGFEPDFGADYLEFVAGVAPVLGFICTLIGFMAAFDRLGVGARLVSVLHALSYSMITSLLGAAISLIFLVAAFFLRRARVLFDAQFTQKPKI